MLSLRGTAMHLHSPSGSSDVTVMLSKDTQDELSLQAFYRHERTHSLIGAIAVKFNIAINDIDLWLRPYSPVAGKFKSIMY